MTTNVTTEGSRNRYQISEETSRNCYWRCERDEVKKMKLNSWKA